MLVGIRNTTRVLITTCCPPWTVEAWRTLYFCVPALDGSSISLEPPHSAKRTTMPPSSATTTVRFLFRKQTNSASSSSFSALMIRIFVKIFKLIESTMDGNQEPLVLDKNISRWIRSLSVDIPLLDNTGFSQTKCISQTFYKNLNLVQSNSTATELHVIHRFPREIIYITSSNPSTERLTLKFIYELSMKSVWIDVIGTFWQQLKDCIRWLNAESTSECWL